MEEVEDPGLEGSELIVVFEKLLEDKGLSVVDCGAVSEWLWDTLILGSCEMEGNVPETRVEVKVLEVVFVAVGFGVLCGNVKGLEVFVAVGTGVICGKVMGLVVPAVELLSDNVMEEQLLFSFI